MELLFHAQNYAIHTVCINVSGEIIYSSIYANKEIFSSASEPSIFSIINKDDVYKISMYENRSGLINTSHPQYTVCLVSVKGKGIGKIIELRFFNNEIRDALADNDQLYKLLIDASSSSYLKKLNLKLLIAKISKILSKRGINLTLDRVENTNIILDAYVIKLMIISVTSMMYDISLDNNIEVSAKLTRYGVRLEFSTAAQTYIGAEGVVNFASAFSYESTKSLFLNTLASGHNIELVFESQDDHATVSFTYPLGESKEFSVLATDKYFTEDENYILDVFFNNGTEN